MSDLEPGYDIVPPDTRELRNTPIGRGSIRECPGNSRFEMVLDADARENHIGRRVPYIYLMIMADGLTLQD